jgi:hypothetical protein
MERGNNGSLVRDLKCHLLSHVLSVCSFHSNVTSRNYRSRSHVIRECSPYGRKRLRQGQSLSFSQRRPRVRLRTRAQESAHSDPSAIGEQSSLKLVSLLRPPQVRSMGLLASGSPWREGGLSQAHGGYGRVLSCPHCPCSACYGGGGEGGGSDLLWLLPQYLIIKMDQFKGVSRR